MIWLDHYLDDFIVVGSPKTTECHQIALDTCCRLGFPVADEKTVGPATLITFLGIEVDSVGMQLRLPMVKLKKLKELVASWRKRKGCRKRELQSLAGHLNHACKVVRPGRRFLRGIFGLLSHFGRRDIRLNAGFRADLEWWHAFVADWNGVTMIRGGELKQGERMVEIWSDASGSWRYGRRSGCRLLGRNGRVLKLKTLLRSPYCGSSCYLGIFMEGAGGVLSL